MDVGSFLRSSPLDGCRNAAEYYLVQCVSTEAVCPLNTPLYLDWRPLTKV